MGRVQLGTCTGPADAAMVRTYFESHGIPVVINAEHHASLLGNLGAGITPLHIYVDEDYAETGADLLRGLRGGDADVAVDDVDETDVPAPEPETNELRELRAAQLRRRRTVVVVLLALFVTFGTAHLLVGAWKRAVVLLVIEGIALSYIVNDRYEGVALLAACMVTDLVGALARVRREVHAVPSARVVA